MTRYIAADLFQKNLEDAAHASETTLEGLLSARLEPGEIERPHQLLEAMRYSALGGGKRVRPFLLIETAKLFGVAGEGVHRAAAALEMIHCYSLVHDDLPAMDDDDLRRGRPTLHKAFDEATAILAGDALLTYAFDVLAEPATHVDPAIRIRLVSELAKASGLGGMVGGQALDLEAEKAKTPHTKQSVLTMQSMKTGALLLFAVNGGAIMGKANKAQRVALERYGKAIGACFQIADDILDAEGDEAALGKRAGKDADRNKATLLAVLGLDEARKYRDLLAIQAIEALEACDFPGKIDTLAQMARFIAERRN